MTDEIERKKTKLQELLRYMKSHINDCLWFDEEIRLQIQGLYNAQIAKFTMWAKPHGGDIEKILQPEHKTELAHFKAILSDRTVIQGLVCS